MKNIIFILLLAPLSIFSQNIDSLRKQTRDSVTTALQKRRVDTAFMIEINATRLDTFNHKRFTIINDSVEVIRVVLPIGSYTTTDTLGNVLTVQDVRFVYFALDNRRKPRAVQEYRQARTRQRQKEIDELLKAAAKIQTDNQ